MASRPGQPTCPRKSPLKACGLKRQSRRPGFQGELAQACSFSPSESQCSLAPPCSFWLPQKIVLFPDLCVRAKIKMLTYCHICCAFYFHPSLISEKIPNFFRGSHPLPESLDCRLSMLGTATTRSPPGFNILEHSPKAHSGSLRCSNTCQKVTAEKYASGNLWFDKLPYLSSMPGLLCLLTRSSSSRPKHSQP